MSEQPTPLPPDVPPDPRGGVRFFSVLLILAGAACFGIVLIVLAAVLLLPEVATGTDAKRLIPAAMIYPILGVAFLALGVGSWKLRRWARPLIMTVGWSWLVTGILGSVFFAIFLPRLLEPLLTRETAGTVGRIALAPMLFVLAVFLLVPTAIVVFYSRPRVRALFDRDPRTYWTDRTHPVLLGIAVLMWVGALACLSGLVYPSVPFFGRMISGWPLRLVILALTGVCVWLGWAVYRRQPAGFWGLVALQVFSLINLWTMRRLDIATMYRGMGYSEREVEQIAHIDIFNDPVVLGVMAVCWLVLTVALFAIRKHFLPARARESAAPPPV